MLFAFAFSVDKDVIEIHYHKNVNLFCQNLVDITLEGGRCVGQSKKYYLVHKMVIAGPEDCFHSLPFLILIQW